MIALVQVFLEVEESTFNDIPAEQGQYASAMTIIILLPRIPSTMDA
jgi:hypothetical protein